MGWSKTFLKHMFTIQGKEGEERKGQKGKGA